MALAHVLNTPPRTTPCCQSVGNACQRQRACQRPPTHAARTARCGAQLRRGPQLVWLRASSPRRCHLRRTLTRQRAAATRSAEQTPSESCAGSRAASARVGQPLDALEHSVDAVQTAARFCFPAAQRVRRRQRRTCGAVRATGHKRGREGAPAVRRRPTNESANFPRSVSHGTLPYARLSPARIIVAAPHPPRACPRRAAQRAACRTRGTARRAARPARAAP